MCSRFCRAIALAALPLLFCGIAVSVASAEIIQIPAVTFSMRSSSVEDGDASQGTLTNAKGKYYAAVPFTESGLRVCVFSLVHRDNDGDSQVIARLFKKPIVTTSGPFNPPMLMAQVATGVAKGATNVAVKADATIKHAVINTATAFYYVELEVTSTLLEVLGVQIDVRSSCVAG
jgi:hypothetical protein